MSEIVFKDESYKIIAICLKAKLISVINGGYISHGINYLNLSKYRYGSNCILW
jgi:hypothetical protein